uniref:Uncharacterized protein n=1 Tax=Romanomermis culicivorax TaxID=13658 RepID=A0A915JMG5_ROMCU
MVHRPEPQRLLVVNAPYTPTTPNSSAVFAYSPVGAMMMGGGHGHHHHQPAMLNPLSLPPTPPLGNCSLVAAGGDPSSRFFNFPSPKSSRPSSAGSDASSSGVWRPW